MPIEKPTKEKVLRKNDVLKKMANSYGLTWAQARLAYDAFVETIGDGIVNGQNIQIGKVLSIKPVWKQPRAVAQNLVVSKGNKVEKTKRVIYLGVRLKYVVRLHKAFMDKRRLNWF